MRQKLIKLKRKLVIIAMVNRLLLQNLISEQEKFCSKISTRKFSNKDRFIGFKYEPYYRNGCHGLMQKSYEF